MTVAEQIKLLQQKEQRIQLFMEPQRETLAVLLLNPQAWTNEVWVTHFEGTIDCINGMRLQAWNAHIGAQKLRMKEDSTV